MAFDSAGRPPGSLNGHRAMVRQIDSGTVIAEGQQIMAIYAPRYRSNTLTNSYPYQLERRRFADWLVAILREAGAELGDMSVLDVGCGTGEILQHLGERGCAQLTGLDVVNTDGVELGKVKGLFETGANDVMIVRGDRERLIPFTRFAVVEVDLDGGKMTVDWDPDF